MNPGVVLPFAGAYFSVSVSLLIVLRNKRSFAYRTFALGMLVLALEAVFQCLSYRAATFEGVAYYGRLRFMVSAFLPGTWLLFGLTYARANYREFLKRWKWIVLTLYAAPALLAVSFRNSLFEITGLEDPWPTLPKLGRAGWILNLVLLLSAVLILGNLERTLRHSTGRIRWQIKFMILGVALLFAGRIYWCSQALLFSTFYPSMDQINAIALIGANALFLWSLFRTRFGDADFYITPGIVHNTLTVSIVGIYLIVVGILALAIRRFNPDRSLPLDAFFVLVALTAVSILLLSDSFRKSLKRFLSRSFVRPKFDYRKEWMELTQRTVSLLDPHSLCTAVTKMLSETLEILSVNIWLLDENVQRLTLAGSTVFSSTEARALAKSGPSARDLIRALQERQDLIDFGRNAPESHEELKTAVIRYLQTPNILYVQPLRAGEEFLGVITLHDPRLEGETLTVEDEDLLETLGNQLAATLLSLRLSERLRQTKEIETFQTVSAFFVHDLKNLASRLSLTMQNLPAHFENPEFRADSLRAIAQSVEKINQMCSQLSLLKQKVEIKLAKTDLNDLVSATLAEIQSTLRVSVVQDLRPVPMVWIDPEQMQKVLTNLLLNASDAVDVQGRIVVGTSQEDGHVLLSVKDSGCGMSQQFMDRCLFRPFRTTKKQGMGIGLFHTKLIVEAHRGMIEVQSAEGRGSDFRISLPLQQVS